MLSEKRINSLIEKNKDLLEALEDFDRTGVLHKVTSKDRVNFTIDSDLMAKFRYYCEKQNQKMSNVVEKLILEELGLSK
jgi:hypothetical protein